MIKTGKTDYYIPLTLRLPLVAALDQDVIDNTGMRWVRAMAEMTSGYNDDPKTILGKRFNVKCDELVVVRHVDFVSVCEHHLLPYVGRAHFGYVPGRHVVGLSKIPRLIVSMAKRLTVQERLTQEIVDTFQEHVECRGVALVMIARHDCVMCRGARQNNIEMITSKLTGVLRKPEARAEFFKLTGV